MRKLEGLGKSLSKNEMKKVHGGVPMCPTEGQTCVADGETGICIGTGSTQYCYCSVARTLKCPNP